ncbi:MAG: septum site-determining protein MinD, partial [Syntrophomonadaceae bacterium]|nr:septum site-determining protein MinD [Syntrophomonadaceae bacterium]
TNKGEPIILNEHSLAAQAFNNIARRILGEEVPVINFDEEMSLWNKIKGMFSGRS